MVTKICFFGVLTPLALSHSLLAAPRVESMRETQRQNSIVSDIGSKLGIVDVDSLGDPVMSMGVFTNGPLSENLLWEGNLDYWNKSTGTLSDRSVSVSDLALGVGLKLLFAKTEQNFKPFLGVGVGVHLIQMDYERRDVTSDEIDPYRSESKDSDTNMSLDIGGGATYQVQRRINLLAELKYRSVLQNAVDLDQWGISAGLAYRM